MDRKNNGRRGMTLVELTIVLAVVAIAAGMVVTFSSLVGGYNQLNKARVEAMQEVSVAEALIESFIEKQDPGTKIEISDEGKRLTFGENESKTSVYLLPSKHLVFTDKEVISFEHINKIEFEIKSDVDTSDTLYYCTISYRVSDVDFTYTFCVNPYAGETIGGSI